MARPPQRMLGLDIAPQQMQQPFQFAQMPQPQQQQSPSMGEAIGAAGSNLARAYSQRHNQDAWAGALQKARPNPEAPVSTIQGAPPPLMQTRRSGFNPMALQQLQGAIGY